MTPHPPSRVMRHLPTLLLCAGAMFVLINCQKNSTTMSTSSADNKTGKSASRSASAAGSTAKPERITLPNGLTIITLEDRSAPVVSVQVWARTGSIHEGTQMGAGLSHILEHMLFKGTEKRGVSDVARQVEAHGGYINAYTTWDRTVYHIDIPADGGKPGTALGTEMAIDILADAMMNSTLPPKEYLLEQKVILREMAMNRDNPDRQATELFFSTAYSTHPSRHPVIGYEEVYVALKREDVMAYYKEKYVPNNLVFVVVGDIDTAKVRDQIKKLTADWKRKPLLPPFVPDEPAQVSGRVAVNESRTAANQTRIHLGWQTVDFRHPDAAPLEILGLIAGHGLSSRLYQALREEKKLVHEVDAWSYTPAWRGVFGASAVVDPDKADATREAIFTELDKFKKTPVSDEELTKARKMALSSHLGSRKTMSGQAGDIASSELLTGDLEFSDKYLADLEKVTAADIQRVANKYFIPETLTVAVLQPKGSLKKEAVKIEKVEEKAVRKTVLPNGLTLLTREEHHLPFVEFRLVMKSGLLFEKPENNGISQLTSKMLIKGTTTRTAAQIARQVESVGGGISTYSGANSMGLSIEVMKSDTALALDILQDIVRNSTFEKAALEREQEAQLAEIKQEKEQPVKIAMQNSRAKLFGAHPYSMPNLGTEKTVNAQTSADIQAFWKRVAVPSNMVLAVYGDIDPAKIEEEVKKTLGALPSQKVEIPKTTAAAFGKADRVTDKQDKEQAVVVISYPGIDLKNPDRAPIELMNAALSGMGSRLFLRLRDQLALCYYVGVNEMIGLDPGFIYFYIGTEPEKAEQAEKEILGEIAKIRDQGITAEELERARNGLVGERTMQKQDLGGLALAAALDELYGLGYDYSDKLTKTYGSVTAEQVQAAAKKYLGQPNVISVVKP